MEIKLSNHCKSINGSLGRGFGYHIQRRKNGFFAKRNTKGIIPPDGHWKFIVDCAELAQSGLIFTDIKVKWDEVREALGEAHFWVAADAVLRNADRQIKSEYDANDIINLKITFGL